MQKKRVILPILFRAMPLDPTVNVVEDGSSKIDREPSLGLFDENLIGVSSGSLVSDGIHCIKGGRDSPGDTTSVLHMRDV